MPAHQISVIVRDDTGKLRVASDRLSIEHTADHAELDKVLKDRIGFGDTSVIVLLDDDSVARHWTRPAAVVAPGEPDQGEDTLGERPRGRGRQARKTAKKKAKR
jgi:hypothetical protein